MSLTRSDLEFLSIFSFIKEGILGRTFSEEVLNSSLVYDPTLYNGQQRTDYKIIDPDSPYGSLVSERGRGLISFEYDSDNPAQVYNSTTSGYVFTYNTPFFNNSFSIPTKREESYIKVYDQNGNLMDRSWYQIDYIKGRIRFPAPTTPSGVVSSGLSPSKIDYKFHLCSVLDGWPTDEIIPTVPFLAIYPTSEMQSGFQLGGGVEFFREYCIDIFVTSTANRRNILNNIQEAMYNRHCPVIDFNRTGQPLKPWGIINENFIQEITLSGGESYRTYLTLNNGNGQILYFSNIEVLYDTSPRGNMSTAMRHMGKIKFKTCTYTDRDPNLVGKFSGLNEPPGGFDSLIKKGYTA